MEDQQTTTPRQQLTATIQANIETFNELYKNNFALFQRALKDVFNKKQREEITETLPQACREIIINSNDKEKPILQYYPAILVNFNRLLVALRIKSAARIQTTHPYVALFFAFKEIENSFRTALLSLLDYQTTINNASKHDQIHDQLKYRLQALIAFLDSAHTYLNQHGVPQKNKQVATNYQILVQVPLDALNNKQVMTYDNDYDPQKLIDVFKSIKKFLNNVKSKIPKLSTLPPVPPSLQLLQLLSTKGLAELESLKSLKETYFTEAQRSIGTYPSTTTNPWTTENILSALPSTELPADLSRNRSLSDWQTPIVTTATRNRSKTITLAERRDTTTEPVDALLPVSNVSFSSNSS